MRGLLAQPRRWRSIDRAGALGVAADLAVAGGIAIIAWQNRGGVVDLGIGLLMAAALLFRRYAPMRTMLGICALGLAQLLFSPSFPTFYDLALLVAMVAVVTHCARPWHAWAAGALVLAGDAVLAAHWALAETDAAVLGVGDFGEYIVVALGCVALWLTAYLLRARKVHAAAAEERALIAERERDHLTRLAVADERAAIARELHDVVAHSLAVMTVQADGASYLVDRDPGRVREALQTIAGTGREALDDMRQIVAVLRGTEAVRDGSGAAPGTAGSGDPRAEGPGSGTVGLFPASGAAGSVPGAGATGAGTRGSDPGSWTAGAGTGGSVPGSGAAGAGTTGSDPGSGWGGAGAGGGEGRALEAVGMTRRPVGLDQLEALVGRAREAGVAVDLRIEGKPDGVSAAHELTIFRLVQESLTNTIRHAGPTAKATVDLRFRADAAVLSVSDDGGGSADLRSGSAVAAAGGRSGLAAAGGRPGSAVTGGRPASGWPGTAAGPAGGHGLIGMRERVTVHGGDFHAGPREGSGWQVTAVIPVRAAR